MDFRKPTHETGCWEDSRDSRHHFAVILTIEWCFDAGRWPSLQIGFPYHPWFQHGDVENPQRFR